MKKVLFLLITFVLSFCLFLCSCSIESKVDDNDVEKIANDEDTSLQESSCDEVGHEFINGVCTRCGEVNKIDMNQRVGKPLDFNFSINSAGGICPYFRAKNISGKTVKYCSITFNFENSVGDPVYDDIRGKDFMVIRLTGPFNSNEEFAINGDLVIGYGQTCYKLYISDIALEYMDGTEETGNYGWYCTLY